MKNIPLQNIDELKRLYASAVLREQEQFMFQGKPVLTEFAKYVIERHER